MSNTDLVNFFAQRVADGRPLVLASVYETAGSTYSKIGARMLIGGDAIFQGMLSGGCLEGDLAERAARVIENDRPEQVTYDLGLNDEELWGLGVGCDGLMRIFLQPLLARLSRKHEFEADAYAVQQSSGADLIHALVKMYRENASTLTPDPLYSSFHDSHPPAPVRISHISGNMGVSSPGG